MPSPPHPPPPSPSPPSPALPPLPPPNPHLLLPALMVSLPPCLPADLTSYPQSSTPASFFLSLSEITDFQFWIHRWWLSPQVQDPSLISLSVGDNLPSHPLNLQPNTSDREASERWPRGSEWRPSRPLVAAAVVNTKAYVWIWKCFHLPAVSRTRWEERQKGDWDCGKSYHSLG